ncbi:REP-associated tyrosine transposase [Thiocystis violacea]|uniref:REP-associated tyrosine transposase n=1 Tax=Thiocystis violacea TaxID=13725 RepID=UPI00190518EF|nr:transposase [Thiocystis violacea]MBK1725053.1 addiction module toxin RelE [Thiocystis violacea]
MARPLRLEFAGALYHVTARGNERRAIFLGDMETDRQRFRETLAETVDRFNWICHAYCLMTNHYHLVIETPEANLSKGMRQLNGVYTQQVNRSHGRVGHLFQGRYKGILVEKESYLLELARYVVLNPVRAGMVASAADWPWSSYRATVGLDEAAPFLFTDWLLGAFGDDRPSAVAAYGRFVAEGMQAPGPWAALKQQLYLGSEAFIERVQARIEPDRPLREVPRRQRRAVPIPLADFAVRYRERDQAIAAAYRTGDYSMQAIADFFGVGRMTVSRAVRQAELQQIHG